MRAFLDRVASSSARSSSSNTCSLVRSSSSGAPARYRASPSRSPCCVAEVGDLLLLRPDGARRSPAAARVPRRGRQTTCSESSCALWSSFWTALLDATILFDEAPELVQSEAWSSMSLPSLLRVKVLHVLLDALDIGGGLRLPLLRLDDGLP